MYKADKSTGWMKRGFTLIELMVTIGLLAIAAAVTMSLIGQGPRQYARDSRRKADLETIRSALEQYRNDQGFYPGAGSWKSALTGGSYISSVPTDPSTGGDYNYAPNGSCGAGSCTYQLSATIEKNSDPSYPTYTVTNP